MKIHSLDLDSPELRTDVLAALEKAGIVVAPEVLEPHVLDVLEGVDEIVDGRTAAVMVEDPLHLLIEETKGSAEKGAQVIDIALASSRPHFILFARAGMIQTLSRYSEEREMACGFAPRTNNPVEVACKNVIWREILNRIPAKDAF